MMRLKQLYTYSLMLILLSSLFQCTSIPKLQREVPSEFEDVYFQKWNSGIEEGGSGITIFIKTKANSVQLDSVYFREGIAKLQISQKDSLLYVGSFKSIAIDKPVERLDIPFKLKDDECVVSYLLDKNTYYYKISSIVEHQTINYPRTSPSKQ